MIYTDPAAVGSGGILGVFLLLYLLSFSLLFVVLRLFQIIFIKKVDENTTESERTNGFWKVSRRPYYIASVVAFAPVGLLAMGSFVQLRVWDISLVCIFVITAVFYVIKRSE